MVRRLFLTPTTLPTETVTRCLTVPSSREWLGIFNAALLQAASAYNYEQVKETDLSPDEVAAKCYEIYEQYIMEDCNVNNCCPDPTEMPPLTRLTYGDLPAFQISTDGGETWQPAPGLDPRNSMVMQPKLSISDGAGMRCLAARNAVGFLTDLKEQMMDALTAGAIAFQVAVVVLAAIAIYFSAGALTPIALQVGAAAFALTAAGLDAAWDTTFVDQMTCCLYDAFADDGTLSDEALQNMLNTCDIGGAAYPIWYLMVNLMGSKGLQNASRTPRSSDYDCGECDDCPDCAVPPGDAILKIITIDLANNDGYQIFTDGTADIGVWYPGQEYTNNYLQLPESVCVVRVSINSGEIADHAVAVMVATHEDTNQTGNFQIDLVPGKTTDKIKIRRQGSTPQGVSITAISLYYCPL